MRRFALIWCILLAACGNPRPDPSPGTPGEPSCPVPSYTDLAMADGRPLAVDLGDLVASDDRLLLLGPQVVTQVTPDSLELHREWLGARFALSALVGDGRSRTGTTPAEPVPLPPGIEPPTLVRGLPDGEGWRVVGTSPLPPGSPGTWVWTAWLGPEGWSGMQGVAVPGLVPPEVGASDLRRAGGDLLWTVPVRAPGGWLLVHLEPRGLAVHPLPLPLPYLVPLRVSPAGLEALWVAAESEAGGSWTNSLFRGVIPLDDPRARTGAVVRRGGADEVHHPLLAPDGEAVGFVSGPSERSRGWILSLEPGGGGTPVPGPAVVEVAPVQDGEDASAAPREWVAVTSGAPPLTLTWLAEGTPEPSVRSRTRIPHGLPPKALRAGNTLLLVGSRFLGPEGPGRFSTVRTAVAVLSPGCVDDARAPLPQTGRSP